MWPWSMLHRDPRVPLGWHAGELLVLPVGQHPIQPHYVCAQLCTAVSAHMYMCKRSQAVFACIYAINL